MTTATLTLSDFILARIAEDEAAILDGWDSDGQARVATVWTGGEPGYTTVASDQRDNAWIADGREVEDARRVQILFDPARVLAECEAKRRIVALFPDGLESDGGGWNEAGAQVLCALASVWSDHPDFRPEWAS